MTERLIPFLLTCGPFVLLLAAWTKLCWAGQRLPLAGLIALGIVSANAVLAAGTFVYYDLRPSHLPPWQDPENLQLDYCFS